MQQAAGYPPQPHPPMAGYPQQQYSQPFPQAVQLPVSENNQVWIYHREVWCGKKFVDRPKFVSLVVLILYFILPT